MTLSGPQLKMLKRVCASNGGGVFAGFSEGDAEARTLRSLEKLGLVQGKLGDPGRAVHTHAGLTLLKELRKEAGNGR